MNMAIRSIHLIESEIDEWIMAYLNTFLDAPDLRIATRWHGTYAGTRPSLSWCFTRRRG